MTRSSATAALHGRPLAEFPALFAGLPAPDTVCGVYRAEFTGPAWLRALAGPGLYPLGLGGWCGKAIAPDGTGVNLVRRRGRLQRVFPIRVSAAVSLLDGRPCIGVRYAPDNPFPWPHVVDELRRWDAATWLGMTLVDAPGLRRLPLPFLLHAAEEALG